jgi:hypothetical protein
MDVYFSGDPRTLNSHAVGTDQHREFEAGWDAGREKHMRDDSVDEGELAYQEHTQIVGVIA